MRCCHRSTATRRPPASVGLKATFTVQLPPAATGAGRHVLEATVKSKPLIVSVLTVNGSLPVLLTVIACVGDVVPTPCEPNARLAAERETPGAEGTPVPLSATEIREPPPTPICSDPVIGPVA